MSSPRLEEFLVRLYTDEAALGAFLRAPAETARAAGLDHAEVSALADADRVGLVMAAASFRAKLARRKRRGPLLRRPRDLIQAVSRLRKNALSV
jgi:hypothetical protein